MAEPGDYVRATLAGKSVVGCVVGTLADGRLILKLLVERRGEAVLIDVDQVEIVVSPKGRADG